MRSEHSTHASYFQEMWKWKSARPTTSQKAGYAPDENFQNEALIRVDTVHLNYVHRDDQTQPTFEMTPGFKPFTEY